MIYAFRAIMPFNLSRHSMIFVEANDSVEASAILDGRGIPHHPNFVQMGKVLIARGNDDVFCPESDGAP